MISIVGKFLRSEGSHNRTCLATAIIRSQGVIPFCQIVDTNKTLNTLLRRNLNQKNGETIFLIWYKS